MAIDRKSIEQEIVLTSGEYFSNTLTVIANAVDYAIKEYSALLATENIATLTTIPGQMVYNLPNDFRTMIEIYPDTGLYNSTYNLNYNLTGLNVYAQNNYAANYNDTYFFDVMMDKIEFYRLQGVLPRTQQWTVDEEAGTITFVHSAIPDPYSNPQIYIYHYYKLFNAQTIPDYHQEHIYKLASAKLLQMQAMAMSKLVQTNGPGLSSTWVSPQVLMTMAKDIREQAVNALATFVPERG